VAQSDTPAAGQALQFEHAILEPGDVPPSPVVVCAGCKVTVATQYYDVNGHPLCRPCRAAATAAARTPKGMGAFIKAAVLGGGAGVVGAAIYYAVIAIAHLEIGIVAILIGYMVGYSVRRGVNGRGGLRFQVLAAALTYMAVALAYTPVAIQEAMREAKPAAQATAIAAPDVERPAPARPGKARLALDVIFLSGLMLALPVLVVIGSMPSGLISALIIFFGMRQAWKMTGAPIIRVAGPYRVGAHRAAP
jgi:hypothetical protein